MQSGRVFGILSSFVIGISFVIWILSFVIPSTSPALLCAKVLRKPFARCVNAQNPPRAIAHHGVGQDVHKLRRVGQIDRARGDQHDFRAGPDLPQCRHEQRRKRVVGSSLDQRELFHQPLERRR